VVNPRSAQIGQFGHLEIGANTLTFERGNGALQVKILMTFSTSNVMRNQERRFRLKPGNDPGFDAKAARIKVSRKSSFRKNPWELPSLLGLVGFRTGTR
jgi:hypothetical protein